MAAGPYENNKGLSYPLTKMNFLVRVANVEGTAAFSQVTGIDASVDVIEFRLYSGFRVQDLDSGVRFRDPW